MRVRYIVAVAILVLFSFTVRAQDNLLVKKLAGRFAKATFTADTKTVLSMSYPGLIKLSGGAEAMAKLINDRIEALRARGVIAFDGWVNAPGPFYKAGTQLLCLLPETVKMKVLNGVYISNSYLLAISNDKGKTWTFMDVGNMPKNVLLRLLPDFNAALEIPAPTPPTFFPDQD
ncbi:MULTISPECIES: hypothetical protein [unclassified Mucilaginibacter]|uniref:hypothetical protein n=1 Tax=unclassified Mucilaginibacter TaxID=2617802 RepID=UPI000AC12633|nr:MULTISPECIES: hypothetical protein [unclassified Mucilaginibacter]HEK19815.1 hypothetical protein [Bacteroidota bacterium]